MKHKDVGAIIVCYNTPELIIRAVESIMEHVFYVYIVDYSDKGSECYEVCEELSDDNINVFDIQVKGNLGHGPGLNIGANICQSKYLIAMDSDAELLDPSLIDEMKAALEPDDVFGSGRVLTVQKNLPYLYMPFCMFKRDLFMASPRFIHDGAPFIEVMRWAKGKYKLVQIPDFDKKILHEGRATRKIAGHWRKGFGGKDGV